VQDLRFLYRSRCWSILVCSFEVVLVVHLNELFSIFFPSLLECITVWEEIDVRSKDVNLIVVYHCFLFLPTK